MAELYVDEMVYQFITLNYSPEQQDELLRGLELCHGFGFGSTDNELVQVVSLQGTLDQPAVRDIVTNIIRNDLITIASEHDVPIIHGTDLHVCNEIVGALANIQCLNDYTVQYNILTSTDGDEEKFADLFDSLSILPSSQVMEYVEYVPPKFIECMTKYVSSKMSTDKKKSTGPNPAVLAKVRSFHEFIGSTENLGRQLVETGVPVGLYMNSYLPYIDIDLDERMNYPQIALDLLSVIIMSCDGNSIPMIIYKRISSSIFDNIDDITKVETAMLRMIGDFEEYESAKKQEKVDAKN